MAALFGNAWGGVNILAHGWWMAPQVVVIVI